MTDTSFSDSYIVTDSELETLIGGDKRASAIALKAASAADQAWYCQEATRHIDALPLRGERYEEEYIENGVQKDINSDGLAQTLEFPRIIDSVTKDWDNDTDLPIIPADVKRACLEEAIAIYALESDSDRTDRATMQADGVKSYNLGGVYSETLGPSSSDAQCGMISKTAWRLMRRYTGIEVR
jgi:hypothetical protein